MWVDWLEFSLPFVVAVLVGLVAIRTLRERKSPRVRKPADPVPARRRRDTWLNNAPPRELTASRIKTGMFVTVVIAAGFGIAVGLKSNDPAWRWAGLEYGVILALFISPIIWALASGVFELVRPASGLTSLLLSTALGALAVACLVGMTEQAPPVEALLYGAAYGALVELLVQVDIRNSADRRQ